MCIRDSSVRSEVDFVLTFEELMGMFEAKQINFDDLPDDPNDNFNNASADGHNRDRAFRSHHHWE